MVCMTFTDWFRGRTSVWFVLLLLIGLGRNGLYYFTDCLEEGLLCICITFTDWFRGRNGLYYFY